MEISDYCNFKNQKLLIRSGSVPDKSAGSPVCKIRDDLCPVNLKDKFSCGFMR